MEELQRVEEEFCAWLAQVDDILLSQWGVGVDDLPDQTWWRWFVRGVTPADAAAEVERRELGY